MYIPIKNQDRLKSLFLVIGALPPGLLRSRTKVESARVLPHGRPGQHRQNQLFHISRLSLAWGVNR